MQSHSFVQRGLALTNCGPSEWQAGRLELLWPAESSVQFIHSVQFKMIFFHAGKGPALTTQSLKSVPDVAVETVH